MGLRIASFVTPHGFGHAARVAAVMEAIHRANGDAGFEIYTGVPQWFFEQSMSAPFGYHDVTTDVGLVQRTPLVEDVGATLDRLDGFLPFDRAFVERLAQQLKKQGVSAVICDIAPLGLAVAAAAEVPSVLVENFTWDWIYEGYAARDPRFVVHANYLSDQFAAADHHVQCEPVCVSGDADLVVPPVSREARRSRRQVREDLGIPEGAPVVLVSMGGVPASYGWIETLASSSDVVFVVPGVGERIERRGGLLTVPADSGLYHPDLVGTVDAVVGKLGYSTVAEVHRAGVPFAYVSRARFREAPSLAAFARRHLGAMPLTTTGFEHGKWIEQIGELLEIGRHSGSETNGADVIARYVLEQVLDVPVSANPGFVLDPPFEQIQVGDTASYTRTVTEGLVEAFAEVSGDVNPLHVDAGFAAASRFGQRVAHGMLAASFISTAIGCKLPGINAVYLGQELKFTAPTRLGDTLTAEVEVLEKREDKPILKLRTTVTRQDGVVVVEGQAIVKKER